MWYRLTAVAVGSPAMGVGVGDVVCEVLSSLTAKLVVTVSRTYQKLQMKTMWLSQKLATVEFLPLRAISLAGIL